MPFDANPQRRLSAQDHRDIVQDPMALAQDGFGALLEANLLTDFDAVVSQSGQLIQAAVLVVMAIVVLGFVGTGIDAIAQRIGIVVQLGAAVVVLVLVGVLAGIRTAIDGVGDIVFVVVQVGTAILVEISIAVFGILRAPIHEVVDRIAVVVVVGTAVVIVHAVHVFGVGAGVAQVGHCIGVVVRF
jgi:hypothetical protein